MGSGPTQGSSLSLIGSLLSTMLCFHTSRMIHWTKLVQLEIVINRSVHNNIDTYLIILFQPLLQFSPLLLIFTLTQLWLQPPVPPLHVMTEKRQCRRTQSFKHHYHYWSLQHIIISEIYINSNVGLISQTTYENLEFLFPSPSFRNSFTTTCVHVMFDVLNTRIGQQLSLTLVSVFHCANGAIGSTWPV